MKFIRVTGQVGGIVARTLLDNGISVRAVVRDATKGVAWKEHGSDVVLADMNDAPVRMEAVPSDTWENLFVSQGIKNPTPRAQMLDGFNED